MKLKSSTALKTFRLLFVLSNLERNFRTSKISNFSVFPTAIVNYTYPECNNLKKKIKNPKEIVKIKEAKVV